MRLRKKGSGLQSNGGNKISHIDGGLFVEADRPN